MGFTELAFVVFLLSLHLNEIHVKTMFKLPHLYQKPKYEVSLR